MKICANPRLPTPEATTRLCPLFRKPLKTASGGTFISTTMSAFIKPLAIARQRNSICLLRTRDIKPTAGHGALRGVLRYNLR